MNFMDVREFFVESVFLCFDTNPIRGIRRKKNGAGKFYFELTTENIGYSSKEYDTESECIEAIGRFLGKLR